MPDPRQFTVKNCTTGEIKSTSDRRRFFGAIRKVGDLEVLNDIGAGKIGLGLRTLSRISDTIRGGCGSLPTAIGSVLGGTLDAGANWVFENVGIAAPVVDAVNSINPGVANRALGQAKSIFENVKNGKFKVTDIPDVLQDIINLERLGRGIFTPPAGDFRSTLRNVCDASAYALDLIEYAPKSKFLFVVELIPNEGYEDLNKLNLSFLVNKSSRPNIKYETEDINFYNFHTKIITKTSYEPMSMSFYDDIQNNAGNFHAAYNKIMSPIANMETWAETNLSEESSFDLTGGATVPGMSFPVTTSSSSLGTLINDNKTILQEIRLFHLFDGGRRMNVYKFFNPRITSFTLDDLDMSVSEKTELTLDFAYDSVYIATDIPFTGNDLASSAQANTRGGIYPLRYNDDASAVTPPVRPAPLPPEPGSVCSPTINTDIVINN